MLVMESLICGEMALSGERTQLTNLTLLPSLPPPGPALLGGQGGVGIQVGARAANRWPGSDELRLRALEDCSVLGWGLTF